MPGDSKKVQIILTTQHMKMHKFSLVAALALGSLMACTGLTSAQDANANTNTNAPANRPRRPPTVEQRVDRMATQLKLTDEQKTKVTAVLEDSAKQMRELRNDKNLTREEQREKFRAMRTESDSKLKQILTPEQWEKYQQRPRPTRPPSPDGEKKADTNTNGQ
jgi:Spy/CpxP family protein refolding chaperone